MVLKLHARQLILAKRMRDRAAAAAKFDDTPEIVYKRIKQYSETVAGAVKPNRKITMVLDAEKEEDEIFESACAIVNCLIETERRKA